MGNLFTRAWHSLTSEKRSVSAENYSPELARVFGLGYGGTTVNEETAMKIGAVYGCVRVLSESVAKLPFQVYERTPNSKTAASTHPVYPLIHSEPNSNMTAFAFWQSLMSIALLYGNAYARIIRGTGSRPASLQLYPAGSVSLHTYKNDLYATTPDGVLPYYELFHLRGLGHGVEGKSPIRQAAENMGISLNAQTFANKFFENGANVGGVLKHPAKLSDTAFNHLRDSWAERHSGVNNAHKPAILEEGMDYARIGIPPNEAQMLETRLFGITDICRIYGVPPHKIAELSKATFSNIEQQNIEFLTDSLLPWLIRIEQECNRKLFRAAEKGRFYCKFNVNALMRGDSAARATFYKELFSIGVFSQNDIRELEEQNPIEGGDRYYVQGNNMVPIDKIDALLAAQTGPEAPKKEENEPE